MQQAAAQAGCSTLTRQQAALQPQVGFTQHGALHLSIDCFLQQSEPQQDFAGPELQQQAAPSLQQTGVCFWQQEQSQHDFSATLSLFNAKASN